MVDYGIGRGDDELLRADRLACRLYAEAVYTLATSPHDLRTRIHDAYVGQAIHANTIVRLLPNHIGERVNLLADRLGTHPDASADESVHAVHQALLAMDDEQLQDVARGICFITHDLTLVDENSSRNLPWADFRGPPGPDMP
jgi:hypothetical protein